MTCDEIQRERYTRVEAMIRVQYPNAKFTRNYWCGRH
jgi:hypothetical protein